MLTNSGMHHNRNLVSFLKKGNTKINNPIGIIKNWFPPHEPMPKAIITPPEIIFKNAIFLFSDFIALKNRYQPKRP